MRRHSVGSAASAILDNSLQSECLQRKADTVSSASQRALRPNLTGLPDDLKSGIENLSGFSMDDVRVHYNSSKPATVQALAYTQGTDIHVAPSQEKHLPHEAWHVVQQKAGRVAPTTNINGLPVNNNAALEHEADVMGEKAARQRKEASELNESHIGEGVCQRTKIHYQPMTIYYTPTNSTTVQSETVGHFTTAELSPGTPIKGTAPGDKEQQGLMDAIKPNDGFGTNPFIKGHLLNHHLGGLGISQNMIPLTANANALHEKFVEQGVKNLVYANELVRNHGNNVGGKTVKTVDEEADAENKIDNEKKAKKPYNKIHKDVLELQKKVDNASGTDVHSTLTIKLQNLQSQEAEYKSKFEQAQQEKKVAIEKMATARIITGQSTDPLRRQSVNGNFDTIYQVQANLLSNQPVNKIQTPEVLLSCSVKYGTNSWNATIHSGPKTNQAAVDGNITDNINNFLSPTQQDPSGLHINYLHVGKQELTDVGWGGLQKGPTNSDYETGWNYEHSGIIINNNTFIHEPTPPDYNINVELFKAMRAIDTLKEGVKAKIHEAALNGTLGDTIQAIQRNVNNRSNTIITMLTLTPIKRQAETDLGKWYSPQKKQNLGEP